MTTPRINGPARAFADVGRMFAAYPGAAPLDHGIDALRLT